MRICYHAPSQGGEITPVPFVWVMYAVVGGMSSKKASLISEYGRAWLPTSSITGEIRLGTISNPRVVIHNRDKTFSCEASVLCTTPPHNGIKDGPFQCNFSLLGKMCNLQMARTTRILGTAMCSSRHPLSKTNMKMDFRLTNSNCTANGKAKPTTMV